MNKISTRDAHMFVAGALCIRGFGSLVYLPHDIFIPFPSVFAVVFTVTAQAIGILIFILGLGILFQRDWALRWAKIFLWFSVVLGILGAASLLIVPTVEEMRRYITILPDELLTSIILLWLLCTKRFENKMPEPVSS